MANFIPARILRADIADDPYFADITERDRRQRDCILRHAPTLFARYGYLLISFTNFATALRMSPVTLRKHFADLDALLAHILLDHLEAIAKAIGDIEAGPANSQAAARAAYLSVARHPFGGLTRTHFLLVHQRQHLPDDLRQQVDNLHHQLGIMCAGDNAAKALCLMDNPCWEAGEIETALARASAPPASVQPAMIQPAIIQPDSAEPAPAQAAPNAIVAFKFKPRPAPMPRAVPDTHCFLPDKDLDDLTRISGVIDPLAGLISQSAPLEFPRERRGD